ncbi:hypothetical protein BDW02DRAFT_567609 [Decorospora gaudefroyi]|uniref:Uncharacterized protein n=1 Tax=Decorospora gaudefroyi TaxID=184978 RepID=A0A6A5KIA7_9PLEO|nr:hypothetical protein BDW02DRAFT_567609 [Decorospora gaudefroyi]
MGALLSLPFTLLNLVLPFTRSGTPLAQDLIHTAILCGTLYFAPQIAEWYNRPPPTEQANNTVQDPPGPEPTEEALHGPGPERDTDADIPLDERLVLQHDGVDAVGEAAARPPPPFAPTPPPRPHVEDEPPEHHAFAHNQADPFAPGPANPPPQNQDRPRPTHANRTIGAKKAKSLARRDQQRAYNEWIRSEAEMRRLQEAEGAEEREAALAAEKARRAAVEDEIRAKEREERERVKRAREREAEEEAQRRERVVDAVREGMRVRDAVDLVDAAYKEGKDRVWVERLIRASGLLQQLQKDRSHVMITGQDWLVRIDAEMMRRAYAHAEVVGERNGGQVSLEQFGAILEEARAAA